jgi:hypothetical protein
MTIFSEGRGRVNDVNPNHFFRLIGIAAAAFLVVIVRMCDQSRHGPRGCAHLLFQKRTRSPSNELTCLRGSFCRFLYSLNVFKPRMANWNRKASSLWVAGSDGIAKRSAQSSARGSSCCSIPASPAPELSGPRTV